MDSDLADAFLSGDAVKLVDHFPDDDVKKIRSRLLGIIRNTQENIEERGLDTLWLAYGIATWKADDGGTDPKAPVILLKILFDPPGRGRDLSFYWRRGAELNRSLVHVLTTEYGVAGLDGVGHQLSGALGDLPVDDVPQALDDVLADFTAAAEGLEGFSIERKMILGNFAFHKLALVQDLQDNLEALLGHEIIAALCGDPDSRDALRERLDAFPKDRLDAIAPEDDFTFLPADSSQMVAIRNVLKGQDGVIQGPPGTGKSQTIANLIGELVAHGKKVLFVAEKAAAIKVVKERLAKAGLDDMVLDLHGNRLAKGEIAEQLRQGLQNIRTAAPVNNADELARLATTRDRLAAYVAKLHGQVQPWGISPRGAMAQVIRFPANARPVTRWRGQTLEGLAGTTVDEARDLFCEAAAHADLFLERSPSLWNKVRIPVGVEVSALLDDVEGAIRALDQLEFALATLVRSEGLRQVASIRDAEGLIEATAATNGLLERVSPRVFTLDLPALIQGLAPAQGGIFHRAWHRVTNPGYRQALRLARTAFLAVLPPTSALATLEASRACLGKWAAFSVTDQWRPRGPLKDGDVRTALTRLRGHLGGLDAVLESPVAGQALGPLRATLDRLLAEQDTLHQVPRVMAVKQRLTDLGVIDLVRELERTGTALEEWPKRFQAAWSLSIVAYFREKNPDLASFNGRSHDGVVNEFRSQEDRREAFAAARIRRTQAVRAIEVMNANPRQADAIRQEAARKYPRPLRHLMDTAPEVMLGVWPCWMASPLSVAQLLTPKAHFDVVIFDEASQIGPEDAISSILRAKRLVVAGDTKQLPPTTFFADGFANAGGQDGGPATQGFESLLHATNGLLPQDGIGDEAGWFLEWHYRSKDESLIAFSNKEIYKYRLMTFPQPHTPKALSFEYVDPGTATDLGQESVGSEVLRVVALVVEHARTRPNESLGVISLGINHARRLQAALDAEAERNGTLADFMRDNSSERFFVKNLERVQGDERDAIILSIGYGQDRTGTLSHNFGPINYDGGERRLNVAITRAKSRMTVVASFRPEDIHPERTTGAGAKLLREYLVFADSGGTALPDIGWTGVAENPFEADIREALEAKGLSIMPQFGTGKYRLDMAVAHPSRPGKYILAIECDGASYHSGASARDRDRLRQRHLEAMGWRFVRIWSTDWFQHREDEITRVVAVYQQAIATGGDDTPNPPPPPAPPPSIIRLVAAGNRGPSPFLGSKRKAITDYSSGELLRLAQWAVSDGLLRTDDEVVDEMASELGFRKGARVVETLKRYAAMVRRARA